MSFETVLNLLNRKLDRTHKHTIFYVTGLQEVVLAVFSDPNNILFFATLLFFMIATGNWFETGM